MKKHPSKLKRICAMTLAALMVMQQSSVSSFAEGQTVQNVAELQPEQAGTEAADNEAVTESENTATAPAETAEQTDTQEPSAQPETTPEAVQPETTPEAELPAATEAPAQEVKQEEAAPTEAPAQETPAAEEPSTEVAAPAAGTEVAPTEAAPTATPEAEKTAFECTVDNVTAAVTLSSPVSDKAAFVIKAYGEGTDYYENAAAVAGQWVESQGLMPLEAAVYDMHFEQEGQELPVAQNASVNLNFACPILTQTPDTDTQTNVYVLHIVNGTAVSAGTANCNGDGAVTSAAINTNGFSPFVFVKAASGDVMAVQEGADENMEDQAGTGTGVNLANVGSGNLSISVIPSSDPLNRENGSIKGVINYSIPNTMKDGSCRAYYTIPTEYLALSDSAEGTIYSSSGVEIGTYTLNTETGLLELLFKKEFYEKSNDIEGYFKFNASVKTDKIKNKNDIPLVFPGFGTVDIKVEPGKVTGNKSGKIKYDENGKPYLEYTVNLNATSDLKDFELTDTLGKNLEFIKGSFTFDDEPVDVTIDGNTAKYTRDSIKSGKHTFKYRAAVKDTSDKQALVNEAEWTWTGGKGEAYPSTNYIDDYTISKKGNNFTGRTAKWNVTLTKGTYSTKDQMGKASYSDKFPSDMKFDSDSLVVKDTENGVTLTKDVDYTVTESEGEFEINFTYTNAQNVPSYSIEYTTTLKDDVETPEDTKEYKNKGTFTPEGEEPKSAEGTSKWESGDTGYTPGTLTKTVDNVTYDGENAISEWTLTIDPQGKTIDKVQLIDEFLRQNIEGMPYLENATGVKADSITITDKDGKEISYTLGANPYEVKPGYYAYWVINLTEPVSDVIMIHYTAVTFGDMINNSSMLVRNNAGLTWKCDGKDKKDNASDQFTYVKRFGVLQKEGKKVSDNLYEWTVRLNVNSDGQNPAMDYGTDQLVFFSDILPEGMEFVTDEGHTPKYGYVDTIYYSANTDAAGIYSVKDGIISATFKGIGKKVIIFTYYTQIKDGYMDGKGDVEFTNKASYGDADGNIADGAVTIKESGNTITKTSSQKDNLIIYTIDINPNADTLNDGEDLELTDAIPESCAYVPDSLETTENGTEIKVSHKYSNRTITVKIPDKKHIVLTYRVKVNGTQGQNIEVTNTAYLSGKVTIHSTNKYKITIQDTSAGAGGTSGVMNLHKIAEEDETKNLQGATFRLQKMKYNADRQIFEADGDPVEEISDKNGYVSFGKENGDGTILTDTLYYYEEISAPEGYITDKTRHYFYVGGNDVTNFEKQLKAAEIVASQENWGEILISNKKEEEKPETTAVLSVSKAVDATPAGSYKGNDKFTFVLAGEKADTPMPEGTGNEVTVTAGGEARSFGSIKYTEAGKYKYTITETVPENKIPGMTYDGTPHEVTVTVSADADGNLSTAVDYGTGGATSLTVTNTYEQPKVSTAFSVEKKVSGEEGFDPEETYKFELTPVTEGAPMPKDESGKTVSVANGETGTFGQITYTEAGKTYEYNITEKAGSTPGMSYDTSPHKVTVTVSETYPLAATVKYDTDQDNLTVNNQYNGLTVKVSKRALKGDEAFALAGAKLQLLDADDQEKPVKEWTSGEAPEAITGLIPGKTYILREISAPDGYTVAEDTQFILNRDGTLAEKTTTVYDKESNTLVVNDKLTSVFINKVTEDGKVLAGATLQVLDSEGKAVTLNDKEVQWETTDQPYEITGLKTDTVYTLHEVKAPDGYTLAADINFTIGTDGKVLIGKEAQADNTIVMTDTLTRVEINKVDAVDGKVLAGAKLQVLGKDGKAAEVNGKKLEWTSTDQPYEITGLKTDTVYTLHETVAPTGYDISADTTFTIGTDGKISKSGTTAKVSDDGILLVEDDVYDAKAEEVDLTATKELTGRNLKDGEFSFKLTPDSNNPESDKNAEKIVQNTAEGNISFGKLKFTEAGTYKYTVSEVAGDNDIITYDNKSYAVIIVVEEGEHGALNIASKTITLNDDTKSEIKFINAYTPKPTTVQIEAEKTVNGEAATGSQFHFTLTPKTDGDKNEAQNVTNEDGKITFAPLEYSKAGTYEYEVAEVQAVPNGYTADKTVYTVTVTVTDNKETGKLEASVSYGEDAEGKERKGITFANTYKADGTTAKIEAEKTVNGEAATGSQFHFTLTPKTDGDKNEAQNVTNVNGKITFADLAYDKAGTYEYEVAEVQEVPNGYTADKTVYTVTVTVTDNKETGKLEAVASYKKGEKSVDKLTFANTYKAEGTTAKIEAEKTVNGEAATGSQFHFTLTPKTDGDKNEAQNVTNVNGKITFADLAYDKAGTYEYEVAEVQAVPNGYTADKTVYTVTVTVTDNKETGKLEAVASYKKGKKSVDKLTFANTYKAEGTTAKIEAEKTVNGEAATGSQFHFTLTPKTDGDKNEAQNVTNVNGKITFADLAYDKAGTYEYEVAEVQAVPNGYTADKTVYTVTVTVIDNKEIGKLEAAVSYKNGDVGVDKIVFRNTSKVSTAFSVKKTVNGADGKAGVEGFDPEETYNFELTPVTEGAPMPTDESGKTVSVVNGETGTFGQITYTEAGKTYEYNITEKAGSTPGMSYDTTPHKVTVTVSETYPLAATVKYDTDQDNLTVNNQYNGLTVKVSKRALKGDEAFALAGAKLQLIDADDQEKPVKEWVSGEAPEEIKGLIPGKTYILREISAPDGYTVAEDTQFVLNRDGTLEEKTTTVYDKESNTLVVNDKLTSVFINKVTEDGKVLAGAILQVLDAEGKAVTLNDKEVQWETTDQPYEITGLKTDTVYTLHEVKAPDGYTLAADINFTIGTDGKVLIGKEAQADNTIVMTDTLTRVEINKVDAVDGKVLAGAKLQVLGKDGKAAEVNGKKLEWTSTEKAHEITGLKTDTVYTLHETVAPTGYDISADTTFTIGTDGKISKSGTTAKVSDDGILLVEDNMLKGASVAVTKKLVYNNMALGAVDQTFHVALYGDEACTKRLTDVKEIVFKNASVSTVNFTNLEIGRKYYVAECTADGTAQSSGTLADGTVYMANFTDGNTVTVNEANGTKTVYFNNEFLTVPDGFYKEGKLNVTKKLLGADGNAKNSDEVFYAGIFDDKDHKILSTHTSENVIPLDLADGSETSYTVNVSVAKDAPCVLYVVETDENGTPVEGAEDFEYEVSYSGDSVTVNDSNMNASVTITNKEKPAEKDKDKKDEDTKKTTTTTTNATTSTNVKTGDNTPIALYVVILLAAAAIVAFIFIFRKKSKKDNK